MASCFQLGCYFCRSVLYTETQLLLHPFSYMGATILMVFFQFSLFGTKICTKIGFFGNLVLHTMTKLGINTMQSTAYI